MKRLVTLIAILGLMTAGSAAAATSDGGRYPEWIKGFRTQQPAARDLPQWVKGYSVPRPPGVGTRSKGQSLREYMAQRGRRLQGVNGRPGTAGLAVCDLYNNVLKAFLPGANNGVGYVGPVPGFASSQRVIVRMDSILPDGSGGWRIDSYADLTSSLSVIYSTWWLGNSAFPYQAHVPFALRGWRTAVVAYEFWWIDQSNPNRWLYDYSSRYCV